MKFRFPTDSQNVYYELISQDKIQSLIDLSAKEGIIPNNNVQYIALIENNDIKSIAGFIIKGKTALFKGFYTPEAYRRQGYGKRLLRARLIFVRNKYNVSKVIGHCTKMSLNTYLSVGFIIVKRYKNGITSVVFRYNS